MIHAVSSRNIWIVVIVLICLFSTYWIINQTPSSTVIAKIKDPSLRSASSTLNEKAKSKSLTAPPTFYSETNRIPGENKSHPLQIDKDKVSASDSVKMKDGNLSGSQANILTENDYQEQLAKSQMLNVAREDERQFLIKKEQLIEEFVQLGGVIDGNGELNIYENISSEEETQRLREIRDTLSTLQLQIEFSRKRVQKIKQQMVD